MLATVLGNVGYEVESALDSMQGTMMVRQLRPRLTVLDIRMPGGGGAAVWERIRNISSAAIMPVLIYSSVPEAEIRASIEGTDDARILAKPASPAELVLAVRDLIGPP